MTMTLHAHITKEYDLFPENGVGWPKTQHLIQSLLKSLKKYTSIIWIKCSKCIKPETVIHCLGRSFQDMHTTYLWCDFLAMKQDLSEY